MRDYTHQPVHLIEDELNRNILAAIDYYLLDLSKGVARIQKGQVPDGSGDPISDQTLSDIYFVLLGRPGDQIGHGGTRAGGNLTLASTTHSTKGNIYFGNGATAGSGMAYDDTNHRLGIQTATPSAYAHIRQYSGGGTQTLHPADNGEGAGAWGTTGGFTRAAALASNDGDTSIVQSADGSTPSASIEFTMTAPAAGTTSTSGWSISFVARKTANFTMSIRISMYTNRLFSAGAFSGGTLMPTFAADATILTNANLSTSQYNTYTRALTATEAAAILASSRTTVAADNTGGTGTGVVNITEVYLTGPGALDPIPLQKWENPAYANQLNFAANGAGSTVLQVSGTTNLNIASSMGLEIASGSPAAGMIAFAANTDGLVRWASASAITTKVQHRFIANGPYRVDNDVDGAYIAPHALTMTTALLYRRQAGSGGTTSVDLRKNGVSMLSSLASVGASGGASATGAGAFSTTTVAAGDRLTVSANAVETGRPSDWVLLIEGY